MSLYSDNSLVRERAKDEYESAGAKAYRCGVPKWMNPYFTPSEQDDARDYAPWTPDLTYRLEAYYWEIGWENEEESIQQHAKP